MAVFVPQTQNMKWSEWAAAFVGYNPSLYLPQPPDEELWGVWGNEIAIVPSLVAYTVPRTTDYKDWQSWAEALTGALDAY
jgi:hypothetical protein